MMSEDRGSAEQSHQETPEADADATKRSYHPPELRELGHLADITESESGQGTADAGSYGS
jgi:hypothetical protein